MFCTLINIELLQINVKLLQINYCKIYLSKLISVKQVLYDVIGVYCYFFA